MSRPWFSTLALTLSRHQTEEVVSGVPARPWFSTLALTLSRHQTEEVVSGVPALC
jgi:hypothetical protein